MDEYLKIDWRGKDRQRLDRMRALFLARSQDGEAAPTADYWTDRRDLELYDATYGARIGWKIDAALAEGVAAGVPPASANGTVVDWGCGAGVASRRAAAAGLLPDGTTVYLIDRSPRARAFASEQLSAACPGLNVRASSVAPAEAPEILLVSHVIGELNLASRRSLLVLAARAATVIWVEPGAKPMAKSLASVRDDLLDSHLPLAPCPHSGPCGTLAPDADDQWCHHFPEPPQEAFIEGFWARFSRELDIDRRSLATSFLVLRRRDLAVEPEQDETRARVLGRPKLLKGKALVDVCDRNGASRCELWKRDAPKVYRTWKKHGRQPLNYRFERDGQRLSRVLEGPGVAGPSDPQENE